MPHDVRREPSTTATALGDGERTARHGPNETDRGYRKAGIRWRRMWSPTDGPQRGGGAIIAPVAAPTVSSSGRADTPATRMSVKQRACLDAVRIVGSHRAWS